MINNINYNETRLLNDKYKKIEINNTINCTYCTVHEINNADKLTIISLNIRSIDCNGDKLKFLISNFQKAPDIILLQEIWKNHNKFHIEGYHKFNFITRKSRGGGVGILIKSDHSYMLIKNLTFIEDSCEMITVSIKHKGKNCVISSIYRPPNNINDKLEDFLTTLERVCKYKNDNYNDCPFYIGGDFNLNLINQNNYFVKKTIEILENNFLLPTINRPTRIHKNSATLIDNIFTNEPNDNMQYIIPDSISDHFILVHLANSKAENRRKCYNKRSFTEDNVRRFTDKLKNTNLNHIINNMDPESSFNLFFETVDNLFNDSFPIKKSYTKNKPLLPWMNKEIKDLQRKESALYIKALNSKSNRDYHINKHKAFKKELNKKIRSVKRSYHLNYLRNNQHNSKNVWKHLNEEIKGCNPDTENITSMKVFNTVYKNPLEIANNLNSYFTSIGSKISEDIPHNQEQEDNYINNLENKNFSFKFKNIQINDILKINASLKNKWSSGNDHFPSRLIKLVIQEIPHVICHLINLSLAEAYIPDRLKEALIIPLHKKGDKEDCNNFRPISLLNSISKILEKAVAFQLRNYLENNDILHNMQFGFRPGHSTNHAMISTIQTLENSDNQNLISNCIFLDLSKAFDTVSHKLLIKKLEKYGIRNQELKWFIAYLHSRKQQCKIGDIISDSLIIKAGVPQGSVLGPILFIIFINDFPLCINNLAISHLFADDTKLYISARSEKALQEKTCKTMEIALRWFNINKLSLNISKTKLIRFNHHFTMDIKLKGESIQIVSSDNLDCENRSFKFLGFLIDEKLNFQTHKMKLIQKLNSALFILRKIKHTLPTSHKILIYNAIFQSHLNYGIICWTQDSALMRKISVLQNKAIKLVEGIYKKSHTEYIYKKLEILKFEDCVTYNRALFAHSIMYNYAPERIQECMEKVNPHPRLRRNLLNFYIDHSIKSSLLKYTIPNTWNNLCNELKKQSKKKTFKNELKAKILSTYTNSQYCQNNNCYLCR